MQYLYFLLYCWTIILIAGLSTIISEASIFPESMLSIIFIALSPIIYSLVKYVKNSSIIRVRLKRFSTYRVILLIVSLILALGIFQPDFLTITSLGIFFATLLFGIDTRIIFIVGFIESLGVIILLFFKQTVPAEYLLTQLFYVLMMGIIVMIIGTNFAEIIDQILKKQESLVHGWKQKVSIDEVIGIFVKYLPLILTLLSIFSEVLYPIGDIYYVVIGVIYLFASFATPPVIFYKNSANDILFLVVSTLSIFLIFYSFSLAEGILASAAYISFVFVLLNKRSLYKKFQLFYK